MFVRIIGSAKNAGAKLRIWRRYRGRTSPDPAGLYVISCENYTRRRPLLVSDDWPRILNADDSPRRSCWGPLSRWRCRRIRAQYFYTCFRTPMRISTRNSARTFNWKSSFSAAAAGRFRPTTIVFCLFSFTPKERRGKRSRASRPKSRHKPAFVPYVFFPYPAKNAKMSRFVKKVICDGIEGPIKKKKKRTHVKM